MNKTLELVLVTTDKNGNTSEQTLYVLHDDNPSLLADLIVAAAEEHCLLGEDDNSNVS